MITNEGINVRRSIRKCLNMQSVANDIHWWPGIQRIFIDYSIKKETELSSGMLRMRCRIFMPTNSEIN